MATQEDVRKICLKLPGAVEGEDRFGFSVEVKGKPKGFCWSWMERVDPKKPKVANDGVLAISVPNLTAKDLITSESPEKFVQDDHYNGFPAVLARLDALSAEEIEDLLIEGWRSKAPPAAVKAFDAGN